MSSNLNNVIVEDNPTIDNKFRIIKRLGHGSFSIVYLVENLENNERIALKALNQKEVFPVSVGDFENEKNMLLSVNHENIIKLLDPNIFEGVVTQAQKVQKVIYILTEFCELGDITNYIKKGFPAKIARFFFRQLISAVEAIHNMNIAHRDIKSPNIVIDKNLKLKLVDFGLASEMKNSLGENILFNSVKGTKYCMAPEIFSGSPFLADKNDIFACGVVLFNFLTGKFPFQIATDYDPMYRILSRKEYIKFWKMNKYSSLAEDAKLLIEGMLCKNPNERLSLEDIKKSDFFNGEIEDIEEINNFIKNTLLI